MQLLYMVMGKREFENLEKETKRDKKAYKEATKTLNKQGAEEERVYNRLGLFLFACGVVVIIFLLWRG